MDRESWIPVDEFCIRYEADYSFIEALHESGLIETTIEEEKLFIPVNQLDDLERFVRLHYDLHINIEGIEAIVHLLHRVKDQQNEIRLLKDAIQFYERGEGITK
ncbi:MAG: chaperone modulator CbpM [Microcoleus sp. C1-bin4]|nr:chaperone modulator CbpM [Microcoleus sp. C1-bin4]